MLSIFHEVNWQTATEFIIEKKCLSVQDFVSTFMKEGAIDPYYLDRYSDLAS